MLRWIHFQMDIKCSPFGREIVDYSTLFTHMAICHSKENTLNNNINATCKVLVPCFMSWNKKSQKCSIHTKSLFILNVVQKCVYIPVSEHFSFAKIIYPPDRCGISRNWLNSMVITQVHLVLGTIKGHSMCSCHSIQCHRCLKFWGSVQLACWLQECLLPEN